MDIENKSIQRITSFVNLINEVHIILVKLYEKYADWLDGGRHLRTEEFVDVKVSFLMIRALVHENKLIEVDEFIKSFIYLVLKRGIDDTKHWAQYGLSNKRIKGKALLYIAHINTFIQEIGAEHVEIPWEENEGEGTLSILYKKLYDLSFSLNYEEGECYFGSKVNDLP